MSGFAVAITIPLMVAIAAIPVVLARFGLASRRQSAIAS
jgi:hypothetical protein